MSTTIPAPLPLPSIDPSEIATWPAAAVAIAGMIGFFTVQIVNLWITMQLRIQAAKAPTQDEVAALGVKVDALGEAVAAHVSADAQWKQDVEQRLHTSLN